MMVFLLKRIKLSSFEAGTIALSEVCRTLSRFRQVCDTLRENQVPTKVFQDGADSESLLQGSQTKHFAGRMERPLHRHYAIGIANSQGVVQNNMLTRDMKADFQNMSLVPDPFKRRSVVFLFVMY